MLKDYKYILDFDEINNEHYFSERIFDDLLMWTMPIYRGCANLDKYIPKDSFIYSEGLSMAQIHGIVNSSTFENNYPAIKTARELLLNKYQLWPRVLETIEGLK